MFGSAFLVISLIFLIPAFFIFRAAGRAEPGAEDEAQGEGNDPAERERDFEVELDSWDP